MQGVKKAAKEGHSKEDRNGFGEEEGLAICPKHKGNGTNQAETNWRRVKQEKAEGRG